MRSTSDRLLLAYLGFQPEMETMFEALSRRGFPKLEKLYQSTSGTVAETRVVRFMYAYIREFACWGAQAVWHCAYQIALRARSLFGTGIEKLSVLLDRALEVGASLLSDIHNHEQGRELASINMQIEAVRDDRIFEWTDTKDSSWHEGYPNYDLLIRIFVYMLGQFTDSDHEWFHDPRINDFGSPTAQGLVLLVVNSIPYESYQQQDTSKIVAVYYSELFLLRKRMIDWYLERRTADSLIYPSKKLIEKLHLSINENDLVS